MSFDTRRLVERLQALERSATVPSRYVVALSGGLDSMVLLHALSVAQKTGLVATPVQALHVDHQLHPGSASWSAFCADEAGRLGIDCVVLQVDVPRDAGKGVEAAAREVRYRAIQAHLLQGDWLLSAHHCDDQAETVLLRLLRGSGPAGIAGIAPIRPLSPGWLARPLLDITRKQLEVYGKEQRVRWIDDPSNLDCDIDRNYLRHAVMPRLRERWPDAARSLARSARHSSGAAGALEELAEQDLQTLNTPASIIPIADLLNLSAARQQNLLRYALRRLDLPTPSTVQMARVFEELIPARDDANPEVVWPGAAVRRYRDRLYLLPDVLPRPPAVAGLSDQPLRLGAGLGSLHLENGGTPGLAEAIVAAGLTVRCRLGGEEIRPYGQSHTRKLKKLLQEEGIVPWMRDRLPLLYANDRLVAVADLWFAADAATDPGVAVNWRGRPALH